MTVEQHQRSGSIEVIKIRQGALAGLAAALAMAGVVMLGFSLSGRGLWTPVNAIGSFWQGGATIAPGFDGSTSLLGLAIQLGMGALLGALYASAQERIDSPSLMVVAIYYGFIIWFVATFLVLSWLIPDLSQLMRNWPFFLAHLAFGAVLGAYAVAHNRPLNAVSSPD